MIRFVGGMVAAALVLSGCGDDDGASTCTAGMSVPCTCTDGRSGAQVCQDDGTFGMCVCEGTMFDAGGEEDAGGTDAGSGTDAGATDAGDGDDAGTPVVDVVDIDTDDDTTCVARMDGTVWCWGGAYDTSPEAVTGAAGAVGVGVGADHYCLVTASGGAACWGENGSSQAGGSGATVETPRSITLVTDFVSVAGGVRHSCGARASGQASCWGDQSEGQLGNGTTSMFSDRTAPDDVEGITNAEQICTGALIGCVRTATGTVACWGRDMGASGDDTDEPTVVAGVSDATDIGCGAATVCAALDDGTAVCWGGSFSAASPISGVTDAVEVAAGQAHGCARTSSGAVQCWGLNNLGQLGDGTGTDSVGTAVSVSGLTDAVQIAAYDHHTCAVRATGDVVCWGGNDAGQLGNGTTIDAGEPVGVTLP